MAFPKSFKTPGSEAAQFDFALALELGWPSVRLMREHLAADEVQAWGRFFLWRSNAAKWEAQKAAMRQRVAAKVGMMRRPERVA